MRRTDAILHNDSVNEIAAGETSPRTYVLMRAAAQDIQRIDWIDRVHEAMTAPTGYRIHAFTSG
ncbi:MAG: hypothetical protein WBK08_10040 [Nitrospira sp.]|jgi:hypothetical protein